MQIREHPAGLLQQVGGQRRVAAGERRHTAHEQPARAVGRLRDRGRDAIEQRLGLGRAALDVEQHGLVEPGARGKVRRPGAIELLGQRGQLALEIGPALREVGQRQREAAAQRRQRLAHGLEGDLRGKQVWPRIVEALPAEQRVAQRVARPRPRGRVDDLRLIERAPGQRHGPARVALGQRPNAAAGRRGHCGRVMHRPHCILNGKGFVPLSVYTLLQHSVMW